MCVTMIVKVFCSLLSIFGCIMRFLIYFWICCRLFLLSLQWKYVFFEKYHSWNSIYRKISKKCGNSAWISFCNSQLLCWICQYQLNQEEMKIITNIIHLQLEFEKRMQVCKLNGILLKCIGALFSWKFSREL